MSPRPIPIHPEPPTPTPQPAPEPTPTPQPQPTPSPTPALPITASTAMRSIGDVGKATWQAELSKVSSPILKELDACIAAASPHGALALTQSARESTYGTAANARANRNPLGLMVPGSNPSRLMAFTTWAAAYAEFARRLSDTRPPYDPADISIQDYLAVYIGGPDCRATNGARCANGETWKGRR